MTFSSTRTHSSRLGLAFLLGCAGLTTIACSDLSKRYPGLKNSFGGGGPGAVVASSSSGGGGTGGVSTSSSGGMGGTGGAVGGGGMTAASTGATTSSAAATSSAVAASSGFMGNCTFGMMTCQTCLKSCVTNINACIGKCATDYTTLETCVCDAQMAMDTPAQAACQATFQAGGALQQAVNDCITTNCINQCQY